MGVRGRGVQNSTRHLETKKKMSLNQSHESNNVWGNFNQYLTAILNHGARAVRRRPTRAANEKEEVLRIRFRTGNGGRARWIAACLVAGAVLAACETGVKPTNKDRPRESQAVIAAATARSLTERGALREPSMIGQPVQASPAGLYGPEFYRGTGELARDTDVEQLDAGIGLNGKITLNFANAEIRDVIDIVLGDTLNLNYVIDPSIQGTITVRTSQPLDRSNVLPALENILSLNGVAMTLVNGTYMVVPKELASKGLVTPAVAPSDSEMARGYGINIIPLNYASANSMVEVLEPFVNPGTLRADNARNLLVFTGSGNETRALMDLVDIFDVDWMSGMSFALFPVDVADVNSLVTDLSAVFLQDGASPLAGLVQFVPIERLNAVLAISPQARYLDRAEIWIKRLDRGIEGAGRRIFVYPVKNARASELAEILSQIFEVRFADGTSPAPVADVAPSLTPVELGAEGQPVPQVSVAAASVPQEIGGLVQETGDIRIIADEAINTLLVLATAGEYRMIEATLRKLDVVPLQVLIEATIAEVLLNDSLKYGIQWAIDAGNLELSLTTISTGAISSVLPGFNALYASSNFRAVLSALTEITDVKIISSPMLMVLDNQTARLQVGDEVPIATQSAVSTTDANAPVVNSIQLRDTGVILEVTPRVNPGGLVLLDVSQEVSTVTETTTSDIDSPTVQQRKIESTVAVQSGETIALGGLIQDDDQERVSGIPVLSDIPLLGNLFKTTDNVSGRRELLVLITPRVVRNQVEAREVTEELRKRLKSLEPLEQKIVPVVDDDAAS